jgi:hypothetical protein
MIDFVCGCLIMSASGALVGYGLGIGPWHGIAVSVGVFMFKRYLWED